MTTKRESEGETVRWNMSVYGLVQGVWFRKYTQQFAEELGVLGTVRNQPDGSVYIEAEATEEVLMRFEARVRQGSPKSEVRRIDRSPGICSGFVDFRIVR